MIKLTKKYLTDISSDSFQEKMGNIYKHFFKLETCEVWIEYDKDDELSFLEFLNDEGSWFEDSYFTIAEMNTLFKPENLKKYLNEDR